jgi:hypothetical protein
MILACISFPSHQKPLEQLEFATNLVGGRDDVSARQPMNFNATS